MFEDIRDITTVAYTNDFDFSVRAQITFHGLFATDGSELSGIARYARLIVTGDKTYTQGTAGYSFSASEEPRRSNRAATVFLDLDPGDSITARVQGALVALPGWYPGVPDTVYKDIALSVTVGIA